MILKLQKQLLELQKEEKRKNKIKQDKKWIRRDYKEKWGKKIKKKKIISNKWRK